MKAHIARLRVITGWIAEDKTLLQEMSLASYGLQRRCSISLRTTRVRSWRYACEDYDMKCSRRFAHRNDWRRSLEIQRTITPTEWALMQSDTNVAPAAFLRAHPQALRSSCISARHDRCTRSASTSARRWMSPMTVQRLRLPLPSALSHVKRLPEYAGTNGWGSCRLRSQHDRNASAVGADDELVPR